TSASPRIPSKRLQERAAAWNDSERSGHAELFAARDRGFSVSTRGFGVAAVRQDACPPEAAAAQRRDASTTGVPNQSPATNVASPTLIPTLISSRRPSRRRL